MRVPVRSYLIAGVSLLGAGALVFPTAVPPAATPERQVTQPQSVLTAVSSVLPANGPNLGYGNEGRFNIGVLNDGNFNIGNRNTGDFNIGTRNTDNFNIGTRNTGNANIGTDNDGDFNIGGSNSGRRNFGVGNDGRQNVGIGNTGVGNVGAFVDNDYTIGVGDVGFQYRRPPASAAATQTAARSTQTASAPKHAAGGAAKKLGASRVQKAVSDLGVKPKHRAARAGGSDD